MCNLVGKSGVDSSHEQQDPNVFVIPSWQQKEHVHSRSKQWIKVGLGMQVSYV